MRTKGKPEELERIRMRAVKAVADGVPQKEVAKVLGVDPTTVCKWFGKYLEDPELLLAKPIRGRPPRLKAGDLVRLAELIRKGPCAFGWENDLWSCSRVAEIIWREFGVKYHPDHVFKLLTAKMKFSFQRLEKVAREKDPEAVARWLKEELPDIKKKSRKRKRPSS